MDNLQEADPPFEIDHGADDEPAFDDSVLKDSADSNVLDGALEDAVAYFTGQRSAEADQATVSAGRHSSNQQDTAPDAATGTIQHAPDDIESSQTEPAAATTPLAELALGLQAGDEIFTVLDDGSITFRASDILGGNTNANGDELSILDIGGVEHGTLIDNGNDTWTYTPNTDWNGAEELTYTVTDGRGETALGAITLDVAALGEASHMTDVWVANQEDVVLSGELAAIDLSGRDLSWSLATNGAPANGTVTIAPDGAYTYTPDDHFNGLDSFTVTISDGAGGTTEQTIAVEVDGTNIAPLVQDTTEAGKEDAPLDGLLTATNLNGDDLTWGLTEGGGPENGSVVIDSDGSYTYQPDENFNGLDTFTVTISNDRGGTAQQTVTVNVEAVNDAPVAQENTDTGTMNAPLDGLLTATDVDADALSFSLDTPAENGAVEVNADGTYTYTPDEGFTGTDSFSFQVEDENGAVTQQDATVLIESDTPEASPDSVIDTAQIAAVSGASDGVQDNALAGGDEATAANDTEDSDVIDGNAGEDDQLNESDDQVDGDDGVDRLNLMGEEGKSGGWTITWGEEGTVGDDYAVDQESSWTVTLDSDNVLQVDDGTYTGDTGLSDDVSGMIPVEDGIDMQVDHMDTFDFT